MSFIELAPAFLGDIAREVDFLTRLGADPEAEWTRADTRMAHRAWFNHVEQRRGGKGPKRPLADVLIGAFASRFDGCITRNPGDFRLVFPGLKVVDP